MKKILVLAALLASFFVGVPEKAQAQSVCTTIIYGAVLTAGQWNACFQAKQDYLGFTPLNPSSLVPSAPVTISTLGGVITIGCPTCATVPGGPTTIGDIAIFSSVSGAVGDAGGGIPNLPLRHPSSGNLFGAGCVTPHQAWWVDQNVCSNADVWQITSSDPSAAFTATIGGMVTTGDKVTLNFTFGSGVCVAGASPACDASYTTIGGDTFQNIGNGLSCAIANNPNLFTLSGATCSGGVVSSSGSPWGGYASGSMIGFVVLIPNGVALDFNSNVALKVTSSVTGAATETVTISNTGCGTQCSYPLDNNPALQFARVSGAAPTPGSTIMSIYAIGATSDCPTSTCIGYGVFSNWVANSTHGSLQSAWLLSTPSAAGVFSAGTWFGQGVYSNYGGVPFGTGSMQDKGPGTFNAGTCYWIDAQVGSYGGDSICRSGSNMAFQTSGDAIVLSSAAGVGINVTPTGSAFVSNLGGFFAGTQIPTTGSGWSLQGGITPVLAAKNYATSAWLASSIQALSIDFEPSGSATSGWTLSANALAPDANNATTLGTAALAPSVVYTRSIDVLGATSGGVTQTAPAVAGSAAIAWGTGSGTPAVTAASPLAINATTGNITCSTCLTGNQTITLSGDVTGSGATAITTTLATTQAAAHTWSLAQTYTVAPVFTDQSGSRTALGLGTIATQNTSAVAITGGTIAGLTGLAIRDTSAAFDVTVAATSGTTLTAGRTLTLNMGNVAHTLAFGTTANSITFPNAASFNVLTDANLVTVAQGGLGIGAGVAGGVPFYSATGTIASSGALTANAIMIGGGTSGPSVSSICSFLTPTVLDCASNANSSPTFLFQNSASDTSDAALLFDKSRAGGNSNSGDTLGQVSFRGFANSAQQLAVNFQGIQTGAATGSNIPTKAIIQTSDASGLLDHTLTYDGTGNLFVPDMTSSSAAQTGTVCWTTGTGKLTVDTTVGCLTSVMSAKNIVEHLNPEKALDIVMRLDPFSFRYKKGYGDSGQYEQFGLGAEEVALVDERLVGRDPKGTLQGVRYQEGVAVLAGAIQRLKADNDNLKQEIIELKKGRSR